MKISDEDKKQLDKLCDKYPIVKSIYDEWNKYQQDPTAEYYLAIVEMTKSLSKEMHNVMNPKKEVIDGKSFSVMDAPILLSEDKLFERIRMLMTDSPKIFEGIEKGKNYLNPFDKKEEIKKEPGVDEHQIL